PIDRRGFADPTDLVNGRDDVDAVVPLRAQLALGLYSLRPGDDHAVPGAPVVAGDLLGPLKRGTHRIRPADRVVVVCLPRADVVRPIEHLLDVLGHAVEKRHFVEQPLEAAFGAGAVVAGDVDDQRAIELTKLFDRFHHAADVVIGLFQVPGVDFHHP